MDHASVLRHRDYKEALPMKKINLQHANQVEKFQHSHKKLLS
jgi:hypothetical protein